MSFVRQETCSDSNRAGSMNEEPKNESNQPERENLSSPLITRRKLLIGGALAAGGLAIGYLTDGKIPFLGGEQKPNPNPSNPASTPESTPSASPSPTEAPTQEPTASGTEADNKLSSRMVLGEERTYIEQMIGFLSYAPDGPITYWTTANGKRRYLITGGDGNFLTGDKGNSTHLLETDGTKTLEEIMVSGEINQESFKEVFAYDENIEYRKFYAGITSVLQIDKSKPDHILGTLHGENRPTRNDSYKFRATVGLVESFNGGLTWQDKGPFIEGTDTRPPGFEDNRREFRVTGAGEPTSIYNENDGYAYFSWVDWRADHAHPDQPYLARAKANENGTLGQLEYWTTDGFNTSFDENKLKTIIPVPDGWVYTALPKLSFNEDSGKYECVGECDLGFWRAESDNLTNWTEPELFYDFSQHGGKPHRILQVGEKWDSYPTILDESRPNSQRIGNKGKFYHSTGDNNNPHEPAVLDYTMEPVA